MMNFTDILFKKGEKDMRNNKLETQKPSFFADLSIDLIVNAITAAKEGYHLSPYFYTMLNNVDAVIYRQEIMKDIEDELYSSIESFAMEMVEMRTCIAKSQKIYYENQQKSWFLIAADMYCNAVETLYRDLANSHIKSHGFLSFTEYLRKYLESDSFSLLHRETEELKASLSSIKYCIRIEGLRVQVEPSNDEINYSDEIEAVFAKFRENAVKGYLLKYPETEEMNHIEAQILEGVVWLFPEVFSKLNHFCEKYPNFVDETIQIFDREVQFYIAYIDYIENIKRAGFGFCYPIVSETDKEIYARKTYDLALAKKQLAQNAPLVVNDFCLQHKERIFVVSGPNQGGKTTFARTFGQLHFFACLGCPVPGKDAALFLPDNIFSIFEKEENIKNLRGKLLDDLVRIYTVLQEITPNSIVILNEIFNSTTLTDQIFLSKKIMEKLIHKDVLGVWVTFIDEMALFSEQTVSMVSDIVPENPVLRTYKIQRNPANGIVYAAFIAEKYRLTYPFLKERLNAVK